MERRVRWKSHARCEAGEKLEIISNSYLSLYIYDIPLTWIKIKKQGNSYVPDEKISLPSKYKLKEELTPYLELKMPIGKYLNHSLKEILEEDPLYLNYILKKSDQVPSQLVEACKVLKKEYMIS